MATTETPYTGLTALVEVDDTELGYMNNVELNLEREVIEIMKFGGTYREKVPAVKNWTASVDGTVAFVAGGSQKALYDAYENGTKVTLKVQLNTGTYFEGSAYVSSLSISGAPDTEMQISAEFEGSGGVTFTLATS